MVKVITAEKTKHHAEILANRVKKRYAHLRKRFARQKIDCFRLYDWDIPEVRAVVDWYAGHIVVSEYVRLQTGPEWLPQMAGSVASALDVPPDKVHIRLRQTKSDKGPRYKRIGKADKRFVVNERDLQFWVNLDDFLDTGLYSDHRDTRVMIRKLAKGKDFLNLFAYTGAFTCAAAAGGARTTTTVDRSATYSKWAGENLKLNKFLGANQKLVQLNVTSFLLKTAQTNQRFTLAFVDPPSFFQDYKKNLSFDVNQDHPQLIKNVLRVMAPGAEVFFSTNHQRFEPRMDGLPVSELKEITPQTIPEDFRNEQVHRCWRMRAV